MIRPVLILSFLLFSFRAWLQPLTVDFKVTDFKDTTALIGYYFGHQKYVLDTLNVTDDRFRLIVEREDIKPGLYFIYTPEYFLEFVLEEKSFSLETTFEGGYKDLMVNGSKENELFKRFQIELGALQKKQRELIEEMKNASGEDSVRIKESLKEVDGQMTDFRKQMTADNPGSFTVSFLRMMEDVDVPPLDSITDAEKRNQLKYHYYKEHYFDLIDLSDNRMLRTPLLYQKVNKYFDEVVIQSPDSLIRKVDWFFSQIGDDQELFRYWLVTLFKKFTESKVMGMDALTIHLIEKYYLTGRADWLTEEYEKKLREEVAYVKPNLLGNKAPELNVVDTQMQPFYLSKVQSPYTLLFIYDPDCGHCKEAIKEIEEYDEKLAQLDVQVLAVCTVTDVERWKEFVSESNPLWLHAIDPTGKSYFRVSYNVRSTPKIYLLDAQKRIIAKQLDIEQIVDFVKRAVEKGS